MRPTTAWHLGCEAFILIIRLAAQAPVRYGRPRSNVRPHISLGMLLPGLDVCQKLKALLLLAPTMRRQSASLTFSRIGVGLCAAYLIVVVLCVLAGLLVSNDPKGRFVFFQLPIAVQGGLLQEVGHGASLEHLSWPLAYLLLGGGTLIALYLVGAAIDRRVAK